MVTVVVYVEGGFSPKICPIQPGDSRFAAFRIFEHFAQRGFEFFLLPSRVHACADTKCVEVPARAQVSRRERAGLTQTVRRLKVEIVTSPLLRYTKDKT